VVIKGADKAHDINVAAGEQGLKIKRGDLEFETDRFVLKKGETIRLKIELLPGKVQVVQGGRVIGEKPLGNDRTAAEWALSLGGTVIIDAGKERTISAAIDLPAGSWTLRRIDLNNNKHVDDAGLKQLAGLKSLQTLDLCGTKVTDAGLKELAGLKSLKGLNLQQTQATDAGLKELAGLKGIQGLNLGGTKVTDAGLKQLASLKGLQVLALQGTPVTGAGLKELASLNGLQDLDLGGTKVTDAGLKMLAGLKSLQVLWLVHTKVTDTGLKELASLKSLRYLNLRETQMTDAGLKELAGLKSLQTLELRDTKVTAQGIATLHKALPGCRIDSDVTPAVAGTDRRAAEWVLSLGGTVTIDDGKERAISAAKELPAGPWMLRRID